MPKEVKKTKMTQLTNVVLHDLGVVTSVNRVRKPTETELQVSLSGLNILGVVDVHRFPPVTVQ